MVRAQPSTAADVVLIHRLLGEGQPAPALRLIDRALTQTPQDVRLRFQRGVALSQLDRKAEAVAVYQKLIADHPQMAAPYNNLAVVLAAMGEFDKAREVLDKAMRTDPAYATAYQNLGQIYGQLASQAYNKALPTERRSPPAPLKLTLLQDLSATGIGPVAATTVAPPPPSPASPPAPVPAPAAVPAPPPAPKPAPATQPATPPTPAAAVAVATAARPAPPPAAPSTAPASLPRPAVAAPAPPSPPRSVAPPAPVTTAATAAVTSPPTATPAVAAAVRAWAQAWSRRDLSAYFSAYTPDFKGQSASRASWQQDRRERIASRKSIRVELSDLVITVNNNGQATARFRQNYQSDTLSTSSRKTLVLSLSASGVWLIQQESTGG